MRPKVYLAGAITGLGYGECVDWREYATGELAKAGIDGFSPMRGKKYLEHEKTVKDQYYTHPMSTAKGITTRDRFDCSTSQVVLVNLIGATRVSIGTVIEIAWADMLRVPVVLCMEDGNIHKHSMLETCVGFIVPTLDEGIDIVRAILTP